MKKEEIQELIETGREIEFNYKGKRYSITYPGEDMKGDFNISFCEFYKDTFDCETVDELWNGIYHGIRISDILKTLDINKIDIF